MQSNGAPIVVVGGGIAGLTAASMLREQHKWVRLFEAGRQLAGLAASFADEQGFSYDFGAHFVTNRLAAAIGAGSLCRDVKYYGESVLLGGKVYPYPFGLVGSPRFALSAIASRFRGYGSKRQAESAAEWFRQNYGRALANAIANPLAEAWSGAPAEELAPAVGEKFGHGIGHILYLRIASRLLGKAIASGYCREEPEGVHVWHVYPEGGVAALCQRLADSLDSVIELQSPVEKIVVQSGRVVGVRVHGKEYEAAAVVSTAPVHILARLVEGSDAVQHLARFRYRPMVFVNLRLEGRGLLPDVVLWTPERDRPFFRLTEAPQSMPWLAPPGKTMITADIGCETGDAVWSMTEEQLGELCLEHLESIVPDVRARYLGCRVLRTPIAYPVFLRHYESERRALQRSTGISGLYSVGRNGEFDHILMEDVYWRTRRRMRHLLDSEPGRAEPS
jgi:protoporphyrinogen/coproporphyrinogen III oxidase